MTTTTQPTDTDIWHVDALDLDAYLARIGQPRATPSIEALTALHEAHVRAIPFENVDPLLGRSPSLELSDIADKLVRRRRGGYCFEHNLLFAAALEQLGYSVVRQAARVQPDKNGPRAHMNLRVHLDGIDYLADTGFGAGVMRPMPLHTDIESDQAGWRYRLSARGGYWRLEKFVDGGWDAEYAFDTEAQLPIDYEVANHYTGTYPRSPFTGKIVAMRLSEGMCREFVGEHLTTKYPDGSEEDTVIGPDELEDVLRSLDLELDPADLALVRERYAGAA